MSYANFQDRSGPGGIIHNPAGAFAREMAKWEMGYSPYGPPGRPREVVGFQEYPAMYYKVKRSATNGDIHVEHYVAAADEVEARNLMSRGYHLGREAAETALRESEELTVPIAAAERAYQEQHMSEKARAEADRVETAAGKHLGEIPETPILRRQPKETK